jgi:hypothetical protein
VLEHDGHPPAQLFGEVLAALALLGAQRLAERDP